METFTHILLDILAHTFLTYIFCLLINILERLAEVERIKPNIFIALFISAIYVLYKHFT